MKKKLLWILYILVVAGFIAYSVCLCVIPEQTNEFTENVKILLQQPIVIAGFTVTVGGIASFVISRYLVKNTKFGRKELDALSGKIEEYKEIIENKANESKNLVCDKINELENLKEQCENKITVVYEEFKELKGNLMDSLKVIPNKKVQEIVSKYEAEFNDREQEIIKKTVDTNEYVNEKIAQLENEFHNALLKLEKTYEERKDNQATEE